MADWLVSEAKKGKYSLVHDVPEEDIMKVWKELALMIQNQMLQVKGLSINGLGTFTFSQRKVDVGGNKFLVLQRPVLQLSEKLIQTLSLSYHKQHATGRISVKLLNYTVLAHNTGLQRESVECCLRELLRAFARRVSSGMSVNLDFNGVGRLVVKGKKAKMKFFKEFIESMDESGNLKSAFKSESRPTTDSRPNSNSSIMSAPLETTVHARPSTTGTLYLPKIVEVNEDDTNQLNLCCSSTPKTSSFEKSSCASKTIAQSPCELVRPETPFHTPKPVSVCKQMTTKTNQVTSSSSRPSTCSHSSNQPDLCYVCHQRAVNNVPISVSAEKQEKEKIQEQMLQEFLHQRDVMELAKDRCKVLQNRQIEQEAAQFNIEKSELKKVKEKQSFSKNQRFYPSYIFQGRSATPCFTKKQIEYCKQLDEQVRRRSFMSKSELKEKQMEIMEQDKLKKELQLIQDDYAKVATEKKMEYLQALNDQVNSKIKLRPLSPMCQPVFAIQDVSQQQQNIERQRAEELYHEQFAQAASKRKTDAMTTEKNRQMEAEQLDINREELLNELKMSRKDRMEVRKDLETSWLEAANKKQPAMRSLEDTEKYLLLQEQCKKYLRCKQCQRKKDNKGASNLLSESRFVAGSRLIA